MISSRPRGWIAPVIATVALFAALSFPVGAAGKSPVVLDHFDRVPPDVISPTGQTVLDDCQAPDPGGWANATARLKVNQSGGDSQVAIRVRDAAPNTLFTIWLRLEGTDSKDNVYGGSPITGGKGTPLAASTELADLAAASPAHSVGTANLVNGFWTDSRGNGMIWLPLDFPVIGGAYPFQNFTGGPPHAAMLPVAIPSSSQSPFTIRIASHCTDGLGHGLAPGPHELWFDWSMDA